MKPKRKFRLKKFNLHPVTSYIILIFLTIIISSILSKLNVQSTYMTINETTNILEQNIESAQNLLKYDELKTVISNASKNFMSFLPLSMLLISSIGLYVAYSTGFIKAFIKRYLSKLENYQITFIIILIGTISTLINDIGYVILIPLAATIFLAKGRNPLVGITAAFGSVAFASSISIFVGSIEVAMIPYTTIASRLLDKAFHVSLTSNLYIMIFFSIVLSIIGTIVVEKILIPNFGRYKEKKEIEIENIEVFDDEIKEQALLEQDFKEKKGLHRALITSAIVIAIFIYMIIPDLPFSGMLLDMKEKTYLNQLFGDNSYFKDGFTYMISLLFLITGISYGISAKTIKNDKELINGATEEMKHLGGLIVLVFFASQFIAIFKRSNLGNVITGWMANIIESIPFGGIPLIIIALLLIAFANFFLTTPQAKWIIISPVLVPALMKTNIAPQFVQFIARAGDSMTDGITPLLANFVIFIGFLNIYNDDPSNSITITSAIKKILPYCVIISITWILLIIGYYLLGLPLGPSVSSTI